MTDQDGLRPTALRRRKVRLRQRIFQMTCWNLIVLETGIAGIGLTRLPLSLCNCITKQQLQHSDWTYAPIGCLVALRAGFVAYSRRAGSNLVLRKEVASNGSSKTTNNNIAVTINMRSRQLLCPFALNRTLPNLSLSNLSLATIIEYLLPVQCRDSNMIPTVIDDKLQCASYRVLHGIQGEITVCELLVTCAVWLQILLNTNFTNPEKIGIDHSF